MSIADNDLEVLELYLDEELDASAVRSLRDRLAIEPELVSALEDLQSERSMRQAVWRAIEPDQLAADRLSWQIKGAMSVQQPARRPGFGQWQMTRFGTAAAACIVLGFFIGRAGRSGQIMSHEATQHESEVAVVTNPTPRVPNTDAGLLVPVTNEYGQVVAWQPFKNPDEAKAFTEDLHRSRGAGAAPAADVRLASEEKF